MSRALNAAYARGWSLATALTDYVLVFRAGDGDFGVFLTGEHDGDLDRVMQEFDLHLYVRGSSRLAGLTREARYLSKTAFA